MQRGLVFNSSGEIIFISPKSFLIFKVFLETILRKITNFTLDQNYSYDYFFLKIQG